MIINENFKSQEDEVVDKMWIIERGKFERKEGIW
jgi:hypothetical protein